MQSLNKSQSMEQIKQQNIKENKKNIETMKRELNLNQYETIINNENEYKNNLEYLKKLEKENEYFTKLTKELKE